jgi:pyrophosphatase PpaX
MTDKSHRYSTILFDFDGTLTPSLELWVQGIRHAFAKFDQYPADEIIINRCFYRDFEEIVHEFKLTSVHEFTQHVHAGLWEAFSQARLFAGVLEVLEECCRRKINLGVVTSSPHAIVSQTLRSLDALRFFESLVTADDITHFKPHPEPVLLSMQRLNARPEETLLIGDSSADILAGRAASIATALFFPESHGQFYDFQTLKDAGPDFVFHTYEDIMAHVVSEAGVELDTLAVPPVSNKNRS